MKKTTAITYGRFQPPTTAHRKLIEVLSKQRADEHLIYLSHSHDAKKNPLQYEEKIYFVDAFFGREFPNVDVVHSPARTFIEVLQELQQLGTTDLILVVGGDRVSEFKTLLDKYNSLPDKKGNIPFSFDSITVVSAGNRDPDADDISGMSATKLRSYVLEGKYDLFAAGVPSDDPKLIKELWDALRRGLKLTEDTEEESTPQTEEKNYDKELEELAKKLNLNAKEEIEALKRDFYAALEKNSKLTVEEFAKNIEQQSKEGLSPEDKKELTTIINKKEIDKAKNIIAAFKRQAPPADGKLGTYGLDPTKATARVFLTYGEPPTLDHLNLITAFARKKPTFNTTNTQLLLRSNKQFSPPLAIVAVVPNLKPVTRQTIDILATWMHLLILKDLPNVVLIYGSIKNIAVILAKYFMAVELTGQQAVVTAYMSEFVKNWSAMRQGTNTVFTAPIIGKTCDIPNIAVQSLIDFKRKKLDKELVKKRLSKFDGEVQEISVEFKNKKKIRLFADAFKWYYATNDLRKDYFIATLPPGDPQLLNDIYTAFVNILKTSKFATAFNFLEEFFSLYDSVATVKLLVDIGDQLGVTSVVKGAVKGAKIAKNLWSGEPLGKDL